MATELSLGNPPLLPHSARTWEDIPRRPFKSFTSQDRKKKNPNYKPFPNPFSQSLLPNPTFKSKPSEFRGQRNKFPSALPALGAAGKGNTLLLITSASASLLGSQLSPEQPGHQQERSLLTCQNTFNLAVIWHRAHQLLAVKPLA